MRTIRAGGAKRSAGATRFFITLLAAISLVLGLTNATLAQERDARRRVQEWTSAWSSLEPETKQELADSWRQAIEEWEGLPPERREEWKQAARDLVDFLQNLTPEQRAKARQFFSKMRETFGTLSDEQKQDFIRVMTDRIQQVQSLTPEQKEGLRTRWKDWVERGRSRRQRD